MHFLDVFRWVCLVIFAVAGLLWLLDMAGLATIRDPAQRKALNFALGTTLLGGMASFAGVSLIGEGSQPTSPGRRDDVPRSPPQNAPDAYEREGPIEPHGEADGVPQGGQAIPDFLGDEIPRAGEAFLQSTGLTRPAIDAGWARSYPACAIAARDARPDKTSARSCFGALDAFNSAVLKPYQDAYDIYVPRVAELSYSQPAGEVLDFLRAEASGFTLGSNRVAAQYREISEVLDADYARLRRYAYG